MWSSSGVTSIESVYLILKEVYVCISCYSSLVGNPTICSIRGRFASLVERTPEGVKKPRCLLCFYQAAWPWAGHAFSKAQCSPQRGGKMNSWVLSNTDIPCFSSVLGPASGSGVLKLVRQTCPHLSLTQLGKKGIPSCTWLPLLCPHMCVQWVIV